MQHLFESDSKFTRFLTAVFDLILLSVLTCAMIATVVCAGVALTALYAVLLKRIRNEEQVLEKGLPGYAAYMQRVRYRVIPFIW